MTGFSALGLSEEILQALEEKGFENPTPIQELTIPILLHSDKDVVGQAQTGTGKTAAFAIPIIEKFDPNNKHIQAIILTPTRELALQVSEEFKSLKGKKKMWVTPVYGGASISMQIRDLEKGTHVVVGTPGRVIDMIDRGKLKLEHVKFVVLDEADEMLNMGFIDDVEQIVKETPADRRMLLFSATMPDRILSLAKRHMGKYEMVSVKKQELTNESIEQTYYEVPERDKFDALTRILDMDANIYGIVFCNTKVDVIGITSKLNELGYPAEALHGDIAQNIREKVVKQFKTEHRGVLVATDVAARGIDISDLSHVINYSLPQDPESYVHRIGRTGRAGKTGKAIALVPNSEKRKLMFISKLSRAEIKKAYLPDAVEMIKLKKERIKNNLLEILAHERHFEYGTFAHELLELGEPYEIVAAVLRYGLKDELDPKAYKNIRQETHDDKRKGGKASNSSQRLFIAKGRNDGINPRKILDIIFEEAQVEGRLIDDIKILDNFSFFSTRAEEADMIVEVFRRKAKGKKPLIVLAKPNQR